MIDFSFAGVQTGSASIGPRGEGIAPRLSSLRPPHYPALLAQHKIIGDIGRAQSRGKTADRRSRGRRWRHVAPDETLLDEVANLVEQPTALLCDFDAEFLNIPPQVLIGVMSKKQRYFTVLGRDGAMLPKFITVRNGNEPGIWIWCAMATRTWCARASPTPPTSSATIIEQPLENSSAAPGHDYVSKQAGLDAGQEQAHRRPGRVHWRTSSALQPATLAIARKAAHLCKADLATGMVVEMTSLQGQMGRDYHKLT